MMANLTIQRVLTTRRDCYYCSFISGYFLKISYFLSTAVLPLVVPLRSSLQGLIFYLSSTFLHKTDRGDAGSRQHTLLLTLHTLSDINGRQMCLKM